MPPYAPSCAPSPRTVPPSRWTLALLTCLLASLIALPLTLFLAPDRANASPIEPASLCNAASISGMVAEDIDGNDRADTGEGIPGVPVTLLRQAQDGTWTTIDGTVTDGQGCYAFEHGILPGVSYRVETDPSTLALAGLRATFDPDGAISSPHQFTFTGPPTGTDFGYQRATPSMCADGSHDLEGMVVRDENRNGRADAGEGIPGVPVTFWLGNLAAGTTTTDAAGCYAFDGLMTNTTHRVAVDPTSPALALLQPFFDPDGPGTPHEFSFVVRPNTTDLGYVPSIVPPTATPTATATTTPPTATPTATATATPLPPTATPTATPPGGSVCADGSFDVQGMVAEDRDGNGSADVGEGVAGVNVRLMRELSSGIWTIDGVTTTDAAGCYSFNLVQRDAGHRVEVDPSHAALVLLDPTFDPDGVATPHRYQFTAATLAETDFGYGPRTAYRIRWGQVATSCAVPGIDLTWTTSEEAAGTLGYEVQRAVGSPDSARITLNAALIDATGAPGSYRLADTQAAVGEHYYYWLLALDADGTSETVGPFWRTCQLPTAVTLSTLDAPAAPTPAPFWTLLVVCVGWALLAAALWHRRHGRRRHGQRA